MQVNSPQSRSSPNFNTPAVRGQTLAEVRIAGLLLFFLNFLFRHFKHFTKHVLTYDFENAC